MAVHLFLRIRRPAKPEGRRQDYKRLNIPSLEAIGVLARIHKTIINHYK